MIDMGLLRGIGTVFALFAFLGVVYWAYGSRSRDAFREAARLPLEEDPGIDPGSRPANARRTAQGTAHD